MSIICVPYNVGRLNNPLTQQMNQYLENIFALQALQDPKVWLDKDEKLNITSMSSSDNRRIVKQLVTWSKGHETPPEGVRKPRQIGLIMRAISSIP